MLLLLILYKETLFLNGFGFMNEINKIKINHHARSFLVIEGFLIYSIQRLINQIRN